MCFFDLSRSLRQAFFISLELRTDARRQISSFSSAIIFWCNSSSFFWASFSLFFLRLVSGMLLLIGTLESASNDGGGYNIPVAKRGVQHPTKPERCSVNATWRIDTVRRIMERVRHVRFIEWMPMQIKHDACRPGDLDQAVDIDVYWRCTEELWGIDIRRKL